MLQAPLCAVHSRARVDIMLSFVRGACSAAYELRVWLWMRYLSAKFLIALERLRLVPCGLVVLCGTLRESSQAKEACTLTARSSSCPASPQGLIDVRHPLCCLGYRRLHGTSVSRVILRNNPASWQRLSAKRRSSTMPKRKMNCHSKLAVRTVDCGASLAFGATLLRLPASCCASCARICATLLPNYCPN